MKKGLLLLLLTVFAARLAVAVDFATAMMNATFEFSNADSTATCFFVRRPAPDNALYLVTAAHVFKEAAGDTAIIVLRKSTSDGSFERCDYTIHIREKGKPLWVRHPKKDVAVLRFNSPLPVAVAALPFKAIADAARMQAAGVHLCSPLFLLTYPERIETHNGGLPVARQGIFASPPLLPISANPTFLTDYTAFPGDSGGPVFIDGRDGRPLVVGIEIERYLNDVHVKNDYEDTLTHHSLGLGKALRAQFIRDTLNLAAKQNVATSK